MAVHTLLAPARATLEVRHSRFLALAAPVPTPTPAAALAFVAAVSDCDASHNCWAYRVGEQSRSSDDGEPGGTAGRPILAAIDGASLDAVVVVVTRWYGGVNLGAGGLVRAYGGCAALCLRDAATAPYVPMTHALLRFAFADTGAVHAALAAARALRLGERFDESSIELRIELPRDELPPLKTRLRDATRGRACLTEIASHA